ncbi:MAG TPA: methyltransferase domain-containing protein [Actinomycetota bacterium]
MDDWRTYDDVAEIYERVHAPHFLEVARDLVAQASIGEPDLILDVGTGTGIAAETAAGAGASVAGIDESIGMLRVARRERPKVAVVAAEAIDLPFGPSTFDAVIGTFVLAHFTKYDTALFELRRVLKMGGRVGFSSWHDGVDAYQDAWRELIESVVPREMLAPAYAEAAPWHDRFRSRESVEETLIDAGFRQVRTEIVKYRWVYNRDDFLDGLTVWATGRFAREMMGETGWAAFRQRAKDVFAERFPDPLNDFREVILATAVKV